MTIKAEQCLITSMFYHQNSLDQWIRFLGLIILYLYRIDVVTTGSKMQGGHKSWRRMLQPSYSMTCTFTSNCSHLHSSSSIATI
jgi:hypothetical protein